MLCRLGQSAEAVLYLADEAGQLCVALDRRKALIQAESHRIVRHVFGGNEGVERYVQRRPDALERQPCGTILSRLEQVDLLSEQLGVQVESNGGDMAALGSAQ